MKSYRLRLYVVIVVLLFCAGSAAATGQNHDAALEVYLTAAVKLGRFGGAVLVARDGRVVLSKGYGLANLELDVANTPHTKFRIGSLTKQFTAAAILLLQERGTLNVADPICKYVSNCPVTWARVTIHHLLTHTSGIPNFTAFPDYARTMREATSVDGLIARFRDKPLEFPPGEQYRYSNSGYALLGSIIATVSGMGYAEFLQRNIFTPLQMRDTGYDTPVRILKNRAAGYSRSGQTTINAPFLAMTIPYAAGALFSTVEDLYRWDQALYSEKLLSRQSLDVMFRAVQNDYGYGWGVGRQFNRMHHTHNGQVNGFTSVISRYPDDRTTIIILTNSDKTTPGVDRVARDLAAILFKEPYELPRERPVVHVHPSILDRYVGRYELAPGFIIAITKVDGQLILQATGQPPYDLTAESETEFLAEVVDARIIFSVEPDGTVTHLTLRQGQDRRAVRIR